MKTVSLLLLLCFSVNVAFSQDATPQPFSRHSIIAQAGSNSLAFGVLYDHVFISKAKWKLTGMTGVNVTPSSESFGVGMPIAVSSLIGKHRNFFEIRTGFTNGYGIEYESKFVESELKTYTNKLYSLTSITTLGYRFQKPEGGVFFNAGVDLLVSAYRDTNITEGYTPDYAEGYFLHNSDRLGLYFGLALGYTFKSKNRG